MTTDNRQLTPQQLSYYAPALSGVQPKTGFPEAEAEPHKSIIKKITAISIKDAKGRIKAFQKCCIEHGLPYDKWIKQILKEDPGKPGIQFSTFADTEKIVGNVTWAWPGWLPIGFLTMIVGMSGEGKSVVLLAILKSFVTGCNWPDGTPFTGETGAALWCETESAQGLNIDRVKRWGIPLDKIYNPFLDTLQNTKLDKHDHWEAINKIARLPEVKVVIVDSLRGAHGGDENSSGTFTIVNGLADLAKNTGKPVILLHHLRKASKDEHGDISLDRIRGSSAIAQPARVIWALDTPDYRTETKRLYVIKTNFKDRPDRIGFNIRDDGLEFGKAPSPPVKETLTDRAMNLLLILLKKGPMKTKEIYKQGEERGLSAKVMRQGKEKLCCRDYQDTTDEVTAWWWALPD